MKRTEVQIELSPSVFFVPPPVRGDRDFWGHGPNSYMSVTLSIQNRNELWVRMYMSAQEDGGDGTTAEGATDYLAWQAPGGASIVAIVSDQVFDHRYRDTNHEQDIFTFNAGLVREVRAVGDTYGDEAGTKTGFQVLYFPVKLVLQDPS